MHFYRMERGPDRSRGWFDRHRRDAHRYRPAGGFDVALGQRPGDPLASLGNRTPEGSLHSGAGIPLDYRDLPRQRLPPPAFGRVGAGRDSNLPTRQVETGDRETFGSRNEIGLGPMDHRGVQTTSQEALESAGARQAHRNRARPTGAQHPLQQDQSRFASTYDDAGGCTRVGGEPAFRHDSIGCVPAIWTQPNRSSH
jgi:hypothetical protein